MFLVSQQSDGGGSGYGPEEVDKQGEKTAAGHSGCVAGLARTSTGQMLYARQSPLPHTLILEICNKLLIISMVLFPLTVHKVT